ncbi:MAG: EamA family transporter [Solirubrobacteraceae bacterium]
MPAPAPQPASSAPTAINKRTSRRPTPSEARRAAKRVGCEGCRSFADDAQNRRRRRAGTAAPLVNVAPVFVARLAAVTLRERLTRRLLAGCAISLAGVGLMPARPMRHGRAMPG